MNACYIFAQVCTFCELKLQWPSNLAKKKFCKRFFTKQERYVAAAEKIKVSKKFSLAFNEEQEDEEKNRIN